MSSHSLCAFSFSEGGGGRRNFDEAFLPAKKHFMTIDAEGNIGTYLMTSLSSEIEKKYNAAIAKTEARFNDSKDYTNAKHSELARLEARLNASIRNATNRIGSLEGKVSTVETELTCPPILQNKNYLGHDINVMSAPDAKACQKQCQGTHFVFRASDRKCWCKGYDSEAVLRGQEKTDRNFVAGATCNPGR